MQQSILQRHYLNYMNLESVHNYKIIKSQNLSAIAIQSLYDKKYNLTEFDIYKYVTAYDFIIESLGCDKYNLTEGIYKNENKYNNILVDLFYHNIPWKITSEYSISEIFSLKQKGSETFDLTKWDLYQLYLNKDNYDDSSYLYSNIKLYKKNYKNYAGNSYTYYIFKQLIKLFLTEVYLYKYNNNILTPKELLEYYQSYISNHPEPSKISTITQLIESGKIKKIKYQCIKVMDPLDINSSTISGLKLFLIDVNKLRNFMESYDTLIEKTFGEFWDYDQELYNKEFLNKLKNKNYLEKLLINKFLEGTLMDESDFLE